MTAGTRPITISMTTVRRFVLGKQGLWPERRWSGMQGTAAAPRARCVSWRRRSTCGPSG